MFVLNFSVFRVEKCKNVNLFEANDLSMMKAAITTKQDLIVLMPKSSSFELIRQTPDYLLHFKQSSFDELIAKQKEALEEFSKFAHEDAKIVYIVDTLNKKETTGVINDFLNKHPEYVLKESEQYFPFGEEDGLFYYAILERKPVEDD